MKKLSTATLFWRTHYERLRADVLMCLIFYSINLVAIAVVACVLIHVPIDTSRFPKNSEVPVLFLLGITVVPLAVYALYFLPEPIKWFAQHTHSHEYRRFLVHDIRASRDQLAGCVDAFTYWPRRLLRGFPRARSVFGT